MRTLTLLACLLFAPHAGAQTQQHQVMALIRLYNEHQPVPLPLPDADRLATLMAGSVVSMTQQINEGDKQAKEIRVVGYRLYRHSRPVIWVAALYKQLNPDGHLIEHLTPGEAGGYRLYQYLPLRWPVKDRHWAISIEKQIALAQSTHGKIWEHYWQLIPDGEARMQVMISQGLVPRLNAKRFKRAVYLPRNRGGWTAFKVSDDVTLLATHVSTVLAGWIPDSWVAAYTRRRLDGMMTGIDEFAGNVNQHYNPQHFLVFNGIGEPIYPQSLQDGGTD